MIRRALHLFFVLLGFMPWAIAMCLMVLSTGCAMLAARALPHAREGNCWSYALDKWARHGGYLLVRAADGQRFLGRFPVPHVEWVKHNDVRYFVPSRRKTTSWVPWYTVYYSGRIWRRERPHDAGPDSSQPPA
jgi:hypothetical protein